MAVLQFPSLAVLLVGTSGTLAPFLINKEDNIWKTTFFKGVRVTYTHFNLKFKRADVPARTVKSCL